MTNLRKALTTSNELKEVESPYFMPCEGDLVSQLMRKLYPYTTDAFIDSIQFKSLVKDLINNSDDLTKIQWLENFTRRMLESIGIQGVSQEILLEFPLVKYFATHIANIALRKNSDPGIKAARKTEYTNAISDAFELAFRPHYFDQSLLAQREFGYGFYLLCGDGLDHAAKNYATHLAGDKKEAVSVFAELKRKGYKPADAISDALQNGNAAEWNDNDYNYANLPEELRKFSAIKYLRRFAIALIAEHAEAKKHEQLWYSKVLSSLTTAKSKQQKKQRENKLNEIYGCINQIIATLELSNRESLSVYALNSADYVQLNKLRNLINDYEKIYTSENLAADTKLHQILAYIKEYSNNLASLNYHELIKKKHIRHVQHYQILAEDSANLGVIMGSPLGAALGTWGGVSLGAKIGALIGTLIAPGVGTIAGAGFGAVVGGLIGAIAGGYTTGKLGGFLMPKLVAKIARYLDDKLFKSDTSDEALQIKRVGLSSAIVGCIIGLISGLAVPIPVVGPFIGLAIGAVVGGTLGVTVAKICHKIGDKFPALKPQRNTMVVAGIGASSFAMVGMIVGTILLPGIGSVIGVIAGAVVGGLIGAAAIAIKNRFYRKNHVTELDMTNDINQGGMLLGAGTAGFFLGPAFKYFPSICGCYHFRSGYWRLGTGNAILANQESKSPYH